MAYINDYQYYENGGNLPADANWGSYQYVSLEEIVNNFVLMYTGNNELLNNVNRYQVLFYAKRGIQELNYDAMKEIKILELDVCDSLRFVLPQDYVNWVRISIYKNQVLMPLSENIQTLWSGAYLQDNNCNILFDQDGNVLKPQHSSLDMDRITGTKKSIYLAAVACFKPNSFHLSSVYSQAAYNKESEEKYLSRHRTFLNTIREGNFK